MPIELSQLFWNYTIAIALVTIGGIYCIIASQNLVRAIVGIEILMKAATLSIILAGRVTGNNGLAQALVITIIVIEVVMMVVAGGIILWVFRHTGDINNKSLTELKG
jgi:NADH:ubiquinone oxidoreductase subunit K